MTVELGENFNILIGRAVDGKYLIASTASPYFLFEGDSEGAVVNKAIAALRFYDSLDSKPITIVASSTQLLTTLVPYKVMKARELADA